MFFDSCHLTFFHNRVVPTLFRLGSFFHISETPEEFAQLLHSFGKTYRGLKFLYSLITEVEARDWIQNSLPYLQEAFPLSLETGNGADLLEGVLSCRTLKIDREDYINLRRRFPFEKKLMKLRASSSVAKK